jgi:hypothetical protein
LIPLFPPPDLAVLGHALSVPEQWELAEMICQRWPEIKLLFLSKGKYSLEEFAPKKFRSDSFQVERFIDDCRTILKR